MKSLNWLGTLGIVGGIAMLLAALVLPYIGPLDVWGFWLTGDERHIEAQIFADSWFAVMAYIVVAAGAMVYSIPAIRAAMSAGSTVPIFMWLSSLTAVFGVVLGYANDGGVLGGPIMIFYWWGLAVIWMTTNAVAVIASRRGSTLVSRDWTLYSVGLAWLPLTMLPQMPMWRFIFADMSAHEAALTAVTSSFAAHYLIVHYLIVERLDRRR